MSLFDRSSEIVAWFKKYALEELEVSESFTDPGGVEHTGSIGGISPTDYTEITDYNQWIGPVSNPTYVIAYSEIDGFQESLSASITLSKDQTWGTDDDPNPAVATQIDSDATSSRKNVSVSILVPAGYSYYIASGDSNNMLSAFKSTL